MTPLRRTGVMLVLLGGALIASAYVGGIAVGYGPPEPLTAGTYFGYVFGSMGAFRVVAETHDNVSTRFSLYILDMNGTCRLLRTENMTGIKPLRMVEDTSYCEIVVDDYPPGKYAVVVTAAGSDMTEPVVCVETLYPHPGALNAGLIVFLVGAIFVLGDINAEYAKAARAMSERIQAEEDAIEEAPATMREGT